MKSVPKYHIRQSFLNGKLSPKSIASTMNSFKNKYDYNVLSDNLPELFKIDKRLMRLIWGNMFPDSLEDLGTTNQYYFRALDERAEINWVMVQVAKNKKKICSYIGYRDRIFNYILLGEYDNAENELEECKKELGVSVWYYEMRILIYSFSGKETKIYEILENVNRVSKESNSKGKTGYVPFLLHFLYLRSSTNTASNFDNELEKLAKRNRNNFQTDRFNYFKHRLNYYLTIDEVELLSPLVYEAPNALIDRYGTLLSVLRSLFLKEAKQRALAVEFSIRLYKIVKDSFLFPLMAYYVENDLPKEYYDNSFIDVLNAYYGQEYDQTLRLCRSFVKNRPCHFNNLRLYVQTLIIQGKHYSPINPDNDSIINDITRCLYAILTEPDNFKSLIELTNLNKRLYGLPIAGEIQAFVEEQGGKDNIPLLAFESFRGFDPLYSKIWEVAEEEKHKHWALNYLDNGINKGVNGIAVQYYKLALNEEGAPRGISQFRIDRDKAIRAFEHEEYDICVDLCRNLLESYPGSLSICQIATEYIFKCYEILGKKMDAIAFYVNQFIEMQSLTNKVRLEKFVLGLRNSKYKGLKNNIDLQIFILLNAEEDEQKARVFEMFMNYKEIENAKGLIEEVRSCKDQRRIELFLTLLINGDVMRHLSYIESTSQMLDEQQVIAQYLTTLQSPYHDYYVEFNKQIVDQTLIYSNIEKLDESRIYVNTEALVKYDLGEYESLYIQLSEIGKASTQASTILFIDVAKGALFELTDPNIIGENILTTKNASMDIAVQLFDSICNKFLFSKFGLKTYLSTRIRHGVLEGELRSVFDSRNLVLLTEGARYKPISYWRDSYGLTGEEQSFLMGVLATFSKELLQTIETFKDEVVQIKTADDGKGMLDYRIPDEIKCTYIYSALYKSNNYQDFCRSLIDSLFGITELSLEKIRNNIKNQLSAKFNNIIDMLEKQLSHLCSKHYYSYVQQAISDSRADLQGKLVKIEKWFTLQSGKLDDFELAGLLRLVWDVTARQYPNIHYNCRFDIDEAQIVFKSDYYLLMSDILTIFYSNIFNHGKNQHNANVVISAKKQGDDMFLHFENLSQKSDEELNKDLKKRLESNVFQSEGGSGLAKVKNIVQSELGGTENDLKAVARDGKCNVDLVLHLNKLKKDYEDSIS